MPIRKTLTFSFLALTLGTLAGHTMPDARMAGVCDLAARRVARTEGVPLDVLRAISRVETGRTRDGALQPWPWTINVAGQGFWFDSEIEAKSYVFNIFKAGKRNFDVGCFQINYRWHGQAFRTIDAMFDPDLNAAYAARFLNQLYAELGSWSAAAGAYHSRTPALANAYTERFQTVMAGLDGTGFAHHPRDPFIGAGLPLVPTPAPGGASGALGSLVPAGGTATAFIVFN